MAFWKLDPWKSLGQRCEDSRFDVVRCEYVNFHVKMRRWIADLHSFFKNPSLRHGKKCCFSGITPDVPGLALDMSIASDEFTKSWTHDFFASRHDMGSWYQNQYHPSILQPPKTHEENHWGTPGVPKTGAFGPWDMNREKRGYPAGTIHYVHFFRTWRL